MDFILTTQGLADRWKCNVETIRKMEREGRIKRIEGVPGIRFSIKNIEDIENQWDNPLSPLERRRLEKQIEVKNREIRELKDILTNVKKLILAGEVKNEISN